MAVLSTEFIYLHSDTEDSFSTHDPNISIQNKVWITDYIWNRECKHLS